MHGNFFRQMEPLKVSLVGFLSWFWVCFFFNVSLIAALTATIQYLSCISKHSNILEAVFSSHKCGYTVFIPASCAVAQRTGFIMVCFFGFHAVLTHAAPPELILLDRGSCCNTYRSFTISTIKNRKKK